MDLNEYQHRAKLTAIYPIDQAIVYPILGLVGEAGELANKYKKVLRDNRPIDGDFVNDLTAELGDVLWYVANIADDLGISLGEIAVRNVEKLSDRKERGVLGGSGDNR